MQDRVKDYNGGNQQNPQQGNFNQNPGFQSQQQQGFQQQPYGGQDYQQQQFQQAPPPIMMQQQQFQPQQQPGMIVMPMQVMNVVPTNSVPPELMHFIQQLSNFKRRLNCWYYMLIVFIVLNLLGLGNVRGETDVVVLMVIGTIISVADNSCWLAGVVNGRKATNEFYLDRLGKIPQFLNASIGFSTVSVIFAIVGGLLKNKTEGYIIAAFGVFFYLLFVWVRIEYFIKPSKMLMNQFLKFKEQFPDGGPVNVINIVSQQLPLHH